MELRVSRSHSMVISHSMTISHRDVTRVRDAMARRFVLAGSPIHMSFPSVVSSSFDFISFRVAVFPARLRLYVV